MSGRLKCAEKMRSPLRVGLSGLEKDVALELWRALLRMVGVGGESHKRRRNMNVRLAFSKQISSLSICGHRDNHRVYR